MKTMYSNHLHQIVPATNNINTIFSTTNIYMQSFIPKQKKNRENQKKRAVINVRRVFFLSEFVENVSKSFLIRYLMNNSNGMSKSANVTNKKLCKCLTMVLNDLKKN